LLIADNHGLAWSCAAHVLTLDKKLVDLMKRAGCWSISFGIESGSPKILESYTKSADMQKIREVVNMTYDAGIKTKGLFMLGAPEETMDTINETVEFIRTLRLSTLNLSKFTPYPGTKYYEMLNIKNKPGSWQKLDGITFTDINKNIPVAVLEKEYKRVLGAFYRNKKIFFEHAGYITHDWDNITRLSKSVLNKIYD
jgi:radical SAM superfamily enzyme YgiQ (UPF0313 family)